MKTTVKKTKQKKKITIRTILVSLGIDPDKKINIRELAVEALSLYALTIIITSLVQVLILRISPNTLGICLIKSAITNTVTAIIAILGLNIPTVKNNVFLSALSYAVISVPYSDSVLIVLFEKNYSLTLLEIFVVYFIVYLFLGFFIQKYLNLFKKLLNRIINSGGH